MPIKTEKKYFSDAVFEKINALEYGEYDNCLFKDCSLMKGDLSDSNFIDCTFENCDLSLTKIMDTSFQNTVFKNCKLLGLHFEKCKPFLFSLGFTDCILNLSSFYRVKLAKSKFVNTSFHESDFTETDLNQTVFDNCDLRGAVFIDSNLEETDFRTAYNYAFDPEQNNIRKAKFSAFGALGLLTKYDIEIE
jgi:uncharacterized protein YjbI with pentapeptide repeats